MIYWSLRLIVCAAVRALPNASAQGDNLALGFNGSTTGYAHHLGMKSEMALVYGIITSACKLYQPCGSTIADVSA